MTVNEDAIVDVENVSRQHTQACFHWLTVPTMNQTCLAYLLFPVMVQVITPGKHGSNF